MAYHTKWGFIISEQNIKMGNIPSFSVTPIKTCPMDAPCVKKCYACKMCKYRDNIYQSYESNYYTLTEKYPKSRQYFVADICEYVHDYEPKYFRFNVAGDVFDIGYIYDMMSIAEQCPDTKFLLFTKQYDTVEKARRVCDFPDNLIVYLSVWDNYKPSEFVKMKYYHVAYYQDKKGKIAINDDSAIVCPENCIKCKRCFKGQGNVIFIEH